MGNPVRPQEVIDIDGIRAGLQGVLSDLSTFSSETKTLFGQVLQSSQQVTAELQRTRDTLGGKVNDTALTQYGQRVETLTGQLSTQRTALESLKTTEEQVNAVQKSLSDQTEKLMKRYSELSGNTAKEVAERKRLASELASLQNQYEKLGKLVSTATKPVKEATGTYEVLTKQVAAAKTQLKALPDAFDDKGQINSLNKKAVELVQRVREGEAAIQKMNGAMKLIRPAAQDAVGSFDHLIKQVQAWRDELKALPNAFDDKGAINALNKKAVELSSKIRIGDEAIRQMSNTLKGVVPEAQAAGGSYAFLTAEVDKLKAELKNLPDAFNDKGEINKLNAKAVELSAKVRAGEDAIQEMNRAMKSVKAPVEAAIGSFDHLSKELVDMKNQLKAMPNAFDQLTGRINRANPAAVELQKRIQSADRSIKEMAKSMGESQRNVGNYGSALQGLASGGLLGFVTTLGVAGTVASALISKLGDAVEVAQKFERIDASLKAVTNDAADFARTQQLLISTSDKLGLSYEVLADTYKGLKAASRGTAIEGEQTEKIFLAIVKASAALKLSSQDTEGALRAVQQMISKGKVSSEELRQQLGERLPGAFKLFADAAGVSEIQLNKMLERGEVLAVDILPKVAQRLETTYGPVAAKNIETLAGATERLTTQSALLIDEFNKQTGITSFFAKFKNGIADTLRLMREAVQSGDWRTFFGLLSNDATSTLQAKSLSKIKDQFVSGSSSAREEILAYVKRVSQGEEDTFFKGTLDAQSAKKLYRELWEANLKIYVKARKDQEQARINAERAETQAAELKADADKKRSEDAVKRDLALARVKTDQQVAQLEIQHAKELISEETYITRKFKIQSDGTKQEIAILKRSTEDRAAEIGAANNKLLQLRADYIKSGKKLSEDEVKNALSDAKSDTQNRLKALESANEEGKLDDPAYNKERYKARIDGAYQTLRILKAAGKEESKEFKDTQKEISDAQADFLDQRNKLNDKAWKQMVKTTREALSTIENQEMQSLNQQLEAIDAAYNDKLLDIERKVLKRQISPIQAQKLRFAAYTEYQDKIEAAIEAATEREKVRDKEAVARLRANAKTAVQLKDAENLEVDNKEEDADKKDEDRHKRKLSRKRKEKEEGIALTREEEQEKQAIIDAAFQLASESISGYYSLQKDLRDQEITALEKQKDNEIELAGDNDEAKKAIEQKYQQRQREIRQKQAKDEKAAAVFSILINTAKAVVAALPVVPLAILVGALGAVQLGLALAKPIPQFYKGKKDDYEGLGIVGDRGFELVERATTGRSRFELAAKEQVTYLHKHDRVYTHEESKRMLRTNHQLAADVQRASPMPWQQTQRPQPVINPQVLTESFKAAIAELPVQELHLGEAGYQRYLRQQNSRVRDLNSYFSYPKTPRRKK